MLKLCVHRMRQSCSQLAWATSIELFQKKENVIMIKMESVSVPCAARKWGCYPILNLEQTSNES